MAMLAELVSNEEPEPVRCQLRIQPSCCRLNYNSWLKSEFQLTQIRSAQFLIRTNLQMQYKWSGY